MPELVSTRSVDEMRGQEFLPAWHPIVDVVVNSSLRYLTLLSVVTADKGLTVGQLGKKLEASQGQDPTLPLVASSNQPCLTMRDSFVPDGLCEAKRIADSREICYSGTLAGRRAISFLGVIGTWELKHDTSLIPFVGPMSARRGGPYERSPGVRLRILQQLVTDGRVSFGGLLRIMPVPYANQVYEGLSWLHNRGIVTHATKFNLAHRSVEITVDDAMETKRNRSIATTALARACNFFLDQGRRRVSGSELVAEAVNGEPLLTSKQLQDRLTNGKLNFLKFVDTDIFGKPTGKTSSRSAFSLKEEFYPPVSELLTSIYSLDDPAFRATAHEAAITILSTPALVNRLLQLPNQASYGVPKVDKTEVPVIREARSAKIRVNPFVELHPEFPDWLLLRLLSSYSDTGARDQALRNLQYLLHEEVLVLQKSEVGGVVAFSNDIKRGLTYLERRALLHTVGLETMVYGDTLTLTTLQKQLQLRPDQSFSNYITDFLVPKINSILGIDKNLK